MHEMVSGGSAQAAFWTDLRKISMCVFCNAKESKKVQYEWINTRIAFRMQLLQEAVGASPTLAKPKIRSDMF